MKTQYYLLPHWKMEGGAGYYIRDLLKIMTSHVNINVVGRYAVDYGLEPCKSLFFKKLGALSFPAYEGVRAIVTLIHLLRSIVLFFQLCITHRNKQFQNLSTVFIFTSSVQVLAILVIRQLYPSSKIVIVIQEQVDFSKFFGKIIAWILRKSDVTIAITNTWATHARQYKINPLVLRNSYDMNYGSPENNDKQEITSDVLYVGGGAKIKGFDNFVAVLPHFLMHPGLRIICLGSYDKPERKLLETIKKKPNSISFLEIVGHVTDIRPYLRGTKLLLLPIGNPHFCRPAIEAGFFSKPFVIPNYIGLDEFAIHDLNCMKYDSKNSKEFFELVIELLNKPEILSKLGKENFEISNLFNQNDLNNQFIINKILNL